MHAPGHSPGLTRRRLLVLLGGSGSTPVSIGRFALAVSVASSACSAPTYSKDSPTVLDWSSWGIGLTTALLNILGSVSYSPGTSAKFGLTELGPALLSGLSTPRYSCWA